MRVVVEYKNTGIIRVVDTSVIMVVNPLPPRPEIDTPMLNGGDFSSRDWKWRKRKLDESKKELCSFSVPHRGDNRTYYCKKHQSWKHHTRNTQKNWMYHPHRTENTPSARVLNPLYCN